MRSKSRASTGNSRKRLTLQTKQTHRSNCSVKTWRWNKIRRTTCWCPWRQRRPRLSIWRNAAPSSSPSSTVVTYWSKSWSWSFRSWHSKSRETRAYWLWHRREARSKTIPRWWVDRLCMKRSRHKVSARHAPRLATKRNANDSYCKSSKSLRWRPFVIPFQYKSAWSTIAGWWIRLNAVNLSLPPRSLDKTSQRSSQTINWLAAWTYCS